MRKRSITLPGPFPLEAGGVLQDITLAFHTPEREYSPGETVVWICHALTANSDPTDWWPGMVGGGCLLDPDKYYTVCVNIPGSPYGSTSPVTPGPDGRLPLLDFPAITVRDMVRACIEVRKVLGINQIDLLIGSSIGGFQALEWTIMEPDVVKNAAFMATAARVPAFLTAFNESQRMALEADPTFREAASPEGGKAGLECARSIALLSYRSFEGYARTQTDADPDTLFASRACSYQRHQGRKLSARFDAYSYYTLSLSLDSHNVGRGRGGTEAALGRVKARTLAVSIDTDGIFPPSEGRRIADGIPGAEFTVIHSDFGHDGFLLENETITRLLTPLLQCK